MTSQKPDEPSSMKTDQRGASPTHMVTDQPVTSSNRDSLLVRAPDSESKGCEFESRQERRENFLL